MHLAPESWPFLPLYAIASYQVYRVNFSKSFFLTFNEKPEENETLKVRLGPAEIDIKNESDRNEDKFLDLFDWKKSLVRRFLSWILFAGSLYLLFFQLRVEITAATITPLVSCLFLMRVLSIGHLLVPLGLNLVMTVFAMDLMEGEELLLSFIYGIFLVIILSLISPSEERLGSKLRDWKSGKWPSLAKVVAILLLSFSAGFYLLKDLNSETRPARVSPENIQEQLQKSNHLQSSLSSMLNIGLMQDPGLFEKVRGHTEKLRQMESAENISHREYQNVVEDGKKLEGEFTEKLVSSPTPELSPELLSWMVEDVSSRSRKEVSVETFRRMEKFLERAQNFNGTGGHGLIGEYRELKFGPGGYFHEETEFDLSSGSEEARSFLEELKSSERKKTETRKKLERNIQEIKESRDEGLLSINKVLKEELLALDSLSDADREKIRTQLQRTSEIQQELLKKARDPQLMGKLEELRTEQDRLGRILTPHMSAAEKSELARRIEEQHRKTVSVGMEVKEKISQEKNLGRRKSPGPDPEETEGSGKLFRAGTIALIGMFIFWFLRRLGRKGVKKVRGIPAEVKEDLVRELQAIRKMNLSPREEVIHTYNLLHDGLRSLIFTNETPPSCLVYEGIRDAEPELTGPTFTVTETFARTLYGEKEVTLPELKSFRREMRKIFSFFEISW